MYKKKRGQIGIQIAVWLLVVVVIGGTIGTLYYQNKQTVLQEKRDVEKEAEEKGTELPTAKKNEITVLKASAYDEEDNNDAQIAVDGYFWTVDADTGKFLGFIGGSSANSLPSTGTLSISPVVTGQKVHGIAFNNTGGVGGRIGYYGEVETKTKLGHETIISEGEEMLLKSHRICRNDQMEGLITYSGSDTNKNISLGASTSDSFEKTRLRINGTDCAYRLGAILVDTIAGSNIENVDLTEDTTALSETPISIKRIKEKDDYVFELDTPKLLIEGQKYYTGTLFVKADGDGCSSAEAVNVSAVDYASYKSAKLKDGNGDLLGILEGYEDNADSPADVGGDDKLYVSEATNSQNGDGSSSFWCNP